MDIRLSKGLAILNNNSNLLFHFDLNCIFLILENWRYLITQNYLFLRLGNLKYNFIINVLI